jgi:nucleoside-diphosphate-sugar epimerase
MGDAQGSAMRAVVFGASGQVGRAAAAALAGQGHDVAAVVRGGRDLPAELVPLGVTRHDPQESRAALIRHLGGADAVFDALAFTAADADDLLAVQEDVGAFCVISTASVYADAMGRGVETGGGFPDYPDPIHEDQPRVPPGEGYSAGKVALENALQSAKTPVAILRPGAIHGIGARHPREFWFVKRALDGRRRVPVIAGGASVFHTTSTLGLASLVAHCLTQRISGIFNAGDPTAPTVADIAAMIGRQMGHDFTLIPVETLPEAADPVGHTPWSAKNPMRLSMNRALATGWEGGPDYAACLPAYVDWLCSNAADWQTAFPVFQNYGHDPFDYAAEDAALA